MTLDAARNWLSALDLADNARTKLASEMVKIAQLEAKHGQITDIRGDTAFDPGGAPDEEQNLPGYPPTWYAWLRLDFGKDWHYISRFLMNEPTSPPREDHCGGVK